uniref:Uncharacterized protein n=1 Tax=Setaria digitata TaxID=48799 RepID=A0A915Q4B2_9BILA
MVDINCSSVLILAAFVRFLQGLPLHQESNSEPFLNYLESFDFDQPNSPLDLNTANSLLIIIFIMISVTVSHFTRSIIMHCTDALYNYTPRVIPAISEDQQLSLPVMNVAHKKNIAIGRADGFRPGK